MPFLPRPPRGRLERRKRLPSKRNAEQRALTSKPVYRPEYFEQMAKPLELSGAAEVPHGIFFGGLGTTGYSWARMAYQLHDRLGMGISVHTLAGHENGAESMRLTTWRDWVRQAETQLREKEGPRIGFGFSTGGLALLHVALANPGICDAIVLVAPALALKNPRYRFSLAAANLLTRTLPGFSRFLQRRQFPFARYSDDMPDEMKQAPRVTRLPGSSFLEFYRMQKVVRKELAALTCPVFVALADQDELIHPKVARLLQHNLPPGSVIANFPSRHNIMLDWNSGEFFNQMTAWIAERTGYRGEREENGLPCNGKATVEFSTLIEALPISDQSIKPIPPSED